MARRWFWPPLVISTPGCDMSLPTAPIVAPNSAPLDKIGRWTIEIVKRSEAAAGFVVLPRCWVVERTFAWLNRNRRLAKDFEATLEGALAWLFLASVKLLIRRLGRIPRLKIVI
jgi:hypothetical protein